MRIGNTEEAFNPHESKPPPDSSDSASPIGQSNLKEYVPRALRSHWRRFAGASLLALSATAFAAINHRRSATEAYITGDVITVRSPLQGRVANEPLSTGEIFTPGSDLITVVASRDEKARQDSARLALERIKQDISATKSQLTNLIQANITRLMNDLESAERELKDLAGMEERYLIQERRYLELVRIGALDGESLAGAKATRNSFSQRRSNQQRIVDNLRKELVNAQRMNAVNSTLLPNPSRRPEILEIEIVQLNKRLQELIASEMENSQKLIMSKSRQSFTYRPEFAGLILSNRTSAGSEINMNDILMTVINCGKLKIEALFDAQKVMDRRVGDIALIKTRASNRKYTGRILSIRGVKSIRLLESADAAQFKPTSDDRMRVQITIPKDLESRECRLGETVEVSL